MSHLSSNTLGHHWIISLLFNMLECITKSESSWVIQAGPVNFDAPICFQHQNRCRSCVRALPGNWIISLLFIMCWCWVRIHRDKVHLRKHHQIWNLYLHVLTAQQRKVPSWITNTNHKGDPARFRTTPVELFQMSWKFILESPRILSLFLFQTCDHYMEKVLPEVRIDPYNWQSPRV